MHASTHPSTHRAYNSYADLLADWEKRGRCVRPSSSCLVFLPFLAHSRLFLAFYLALSCLALLSNDVSLQPEGIAIDSFFAPSRLLLAFGLWPFLALSCLVLPFFDPSRLFLAFGLVPLAMLFWPFRARAVRPRLVFFSRLSHLLLWPSHTPPHHHHHHTIPLPPFPQNQHKTHTTRHSESNPNPNPLPSPLSPKHHKPNTNRHSESQEARAKAKAIPLLRLSPTVPASQMVFIEGGLPGEVNYL